MPKLKIEDPKLVFSLCYQTYEIRRIVAPVRLKSFGGPRTLTFPIEDFGGRVASIWSELRPATRGLVERALQLSNAPNSPGRNLPYDTRADFELSRLLTALDERAAEIASNANHPELRKLAETCAAVLQEKTQSAEVLSQLIRRAAAQRDYVRIDALADALSRFAPTEICELARTDDVVVRALANEALAQVPTGTLMALLADPVDADVAREGLRRQAMEFGSDEARQVLFALQQIDGADDEI
jgi:hypothetical protein